MEKAKSGHYYLKTRISPKERELFFAAARDMDVPYYLLMRHLVRYALQSETDWPELLKRLNADSENPEREETKVNMRTQIPPELYAAFANFAEKWGSNVNTVMRKLILLYIASTIERHVIIEPLTL